MRTYAGEGAFDELTFGVIGREGRVEHEGADEMASLENSGCRGSTEVEGEHDERKIEEAVSEESLGFSL